MSVIGFRCSSSEYAVCVLSGTRAAPQIDNAKRQKYPKGYAEAELLEWLYQELQAVFRTADCETVGVKKAEGTVRRSNNLETRVQGEAIAALVAAQTGCHVVHRKVNSTIARDLGLKGKGKYLQTQLDTSPLANFQSYPPLIQEALLVAWSCM